MTKAELLQELNVKFYKVGVPDLKQSYDNIKYYTVSVFDKTGDALRDINIPFYVENEGGGSESAYWTPSEPKPTPEIRFQQEVDTFIASKITAGTIEGAFSVELDATNENAIFKVIMPDLAERKLFVDRDINGDLRHRNMA